MVFVDELPRNPTGNVVKRELAKGTESSENGGGSLVPQQRNHAVGRRIVTEQLTEWPHMTAARRG